LDTIKKNGWEVLSHLPHNPGLALSGYHLFWILKYHMRGQHYMNDNAVQEGIYSWLQGDGMDFFTAVGSLSACRTGRSAWIMLEIL
jgi:hypothetical protein